jgi:hypothetical protein
VRGRDTGEAPSRPAPPLRRGATAIRGHGHASLNPQRIERTATEASHKFAVKTLTRNLPENLITECIPFLNFANIAPPRHGPNPDADIEDVYGLRESVSNVTGTAVPVIYELRSRNNFQARRARLHREVQQSEVQGV